MPSGASARASWALVCAGTTVMRQPLSARTRRMLRLMPKSYATTCRRCGERIGVNVLVTDEDVIENNFSCVVALRSDRLGSDDRLIGQREHRRSDNVINTHRRRYTNREEFSANILPPGLD